MGRLPRIKRKDLTGTFKKCSYQSVLGSYLTGVTPKWFRFDMIITQNKLFLTLKNCQNLPIHSSLYDLVSHTPPKELLSPKFSACVVQPFLWKICGMTKMENSLRHGFCFVYFRQVGNITEIKVNQQRLCLRSFNFINNARYMDASRLGKTSTAVVVP